MKIRISIDFCKNEALNRKIIKFNMFYNSSVITCNSMVGMKTKIHCERLHVMELRSLLY